jgi:peptidoglycan/LPS O-acetylase OafA/YrhL/ABC-type polysaccharide/polyol phosphate export permease
MTIEAYPAGGKSAPSAMLQDRDADRLLALDALRGIAALAVLLIHIGFLSGERWLAPFGFLAVDLFFMISGFVIGHAFEPKLACGMSRRRFMALRLVRLYPTLLLGLMLGVASYFTAPPGGYELGWASLGHLLLVPDIFSAGLFPLNGVFWTLFFELAINGVHAIFIRQLTTRRLALLVLLSGIAWALTAIALGDWGAGWNGDTFAGGAARVAWGYGIGLLLYRLWHAGALKPPPLPFMLPLALAGLLLIAPRFGVPLLRVCASAFLLLPLIVLIAAQARAPRSSRAIAEWLGAISYPLYAVHLPLLVVAGTLVHGRLQILQWTASGLACLGIATAVAHWYDLPLRRFLRSRIGSESLPGSASETRETVYSAASVLRSPRMFWGGARRDLHLSVGIGWRLFRSELRARRRYSLLGHGWLFLPAAATALVCTYLQRRGIVGLPETILPYPLFVLSGVLFWQTFTDGLNAPLRQLTAMRQLITRSRVPHEAVLAAGAAGVALNGAIRLGLLLALLPLFDIAPALSWLLLPIGFFALALLGFAFGLMIAPFGLLSEDVGRALPIATLFWFFLTPVAYPIPAGADWLRLNPVLPLIDAVRSWMHGSSTAGAFIVVLAASTLLLAWGALSYRVARPHLIARLG